MQPFTQEPRTALTEAQVKYLLVESPRQDWSFGADLLNFDLSLAGSMDLISGSVRRSFLANYHGTCDLEFDSTFDYARGLVRPWMRVSDAGLSALFYCGVYTLTTPTSKYGVEKPVAAHVQGYDRLYLLDREIGYTWVAPSGATVFSEIQRALTASGLTGLLLDGTKSAAVLPTDMIWPLVQPVSPTTPSYDLSEEQQRTGLQNATTWLRVINDLLFSIGYMGLYADPASGIFRSQPYVPPANRSPEYVYDFDAVLPVVAPERQREDDTFKAPNKWIFIRQNMPGDPPATPVEGAGVYTVDKTGSDARQLTWAKQIPLDVIDQASLVAQGDARVAQDLRKKTAYTVSTAPWPLAGHGDVYTYKDAEQGKDIKVQEREWSLNLNGQEDMQRSWDEVV